VEWVNVSCAVKKPKVLFSKATVKIYICRIECPKEYHKPIKGVKLRIQKRLRESDG